MDRARRGGPPEPIDVDVRRQGQRVRPAVPKQLLNSRDIAAGTGRVCFGAVRCGRPDLRAPLGAPKVASDHHGARRFHPLGLSSEREAIFGSMSSPKAKSAERSRFGVAVSAPEPRISACRPVATAAIKELEQRLGNRLLQRSTRHL